MRYITLNFKDLSNISPFVYISNLDVLYFNSCKGGGGGGELPLFITKCTYLQAGPLRHP